MKIHYKEFQDILKQLSEELDQFKYLHCKRITMGCLVRDEELVYQSLMYSIPNLLCKIKDVDKIQFIEKGKG